MGIWTLTSLSHPNREPIANYVLFSQRGYVHHAVLMDIDSTMHTNGGFCIGEREFPMPGGEFIGWGQESNEDGVWMFTTQDGKLNSGWYRGARASMLATGELVSYVNETKRIYLDMDVEYVKVRLSLKA
jgi:hypothetical protein